MEAGIRTDRATHEAGFSLIEATIATGVLTVAAGAMLAAATASLHARTLTGSDAALMSAAQNALVDLRAATAYDAGTLTALAGRSVTYRVEAPQPGDAGRALTVRVAVAAPDADGAAAVDVSVTDGHGARAHAEGVLTIEAPPPGATVQAALDATSTP